MSAPCRVVSAAHQFCNHSDCNEAAAETQLVAGAVGDPANGGGGFVGTLALFSDSGGRLVLVVGVPWPEVASRSSSMKSPRRRSPAASTPIGGRTPLPREGVGSPALSWRGRDQFDRPAR